MTGGIKMPRKTAIEKRNISGQRIKDRRLELELTQAQVAARMELQGIMWDQKIVSRVELQIRTVTDFELQAIANALDISLDELIYGEKKRKTAKRK